MKRLIMFVLCFQVITLVSAQDNLEGKWELTTFHYIERAYPPVISEYEITQIFQFTNDGIFKLLSKEDQEMITRGFYKKYSGDDLSLIDEYIHAIKILYQDGSIDLLLFKPLDEKTIFVTIASLVKSEDQLETPVRTGLMKRLD